VALRRVRRYGSLKKLHPEGFKDVRKLLQRMAGEYTPEDFEVFLARYWEGDREKIRRIEKEVRGD